MIARSLNHIVGVLLSTSLIIMLLIPSAQWLFEFGPEVPLYGYTPPIVDKPDDYLKGFFNKSLQSWSEKYVQHHLGFRATLVRTYNEINYRLFRTTNTKIVTTPKHGLYSNLSIDYLNYEITHKSELEKNYEIEAKKLLEIQKYLASQGKFFQVVIASSKAYIYPEELGNRYLFGGTNKHLFNKTVSFGNILKATGVNVIDAGPILRQLNHNIKLETHPASGVHWNFAAGCIIASRIIVNAQHVLPNLPQLNCGTFQRVHSPLYNVNNDGYLLLNLWSDFGLLKKTTEPTHITLEKKQTGWHPNVVFIGDSYSAQILYAYEQTKLFNQMVMSSYFQKRDIVNSKIPKKNSRPIQEQVIRDIVNSDIIILEMVDYNVNRFSYGFSNYGNQLKQALSKQNVHSRREFIQRELTSSAGAYDREENGRHWWQWVNAQVTYTFKPLVSSTKNLKTHIEFSYGLRNPQTLTIGILTTKNTRISFKIPKNRATEGVFSRNIAIPLQEIKSVQIRTDAQPRKLSATDPRITSWRILDFKLNNNVPAMNLRKHNQEILAELLASEAAYGREQDASLVAMD
ncbi:MAG: hypothetical protein NTW08_00450 [Gammaproteobacteria bacterium]|nr:hypothetical protein [Gammaproteobacteria bacterium]